MSIAGSILGLLVGVVKDFIIPAAKLSLKFLFHLFVSGFRGLGNSLGRLSKRTFRGLKALSKIQRVLSPRFFRDLVKALRTAFRKILLIVDGVLAPILQLQKCTNLVLDSVHRRILRPILDLFFRVHQVFGILGVIFPGLGRALDRRLFKVERGIFGGFLKARIFLNQHGNFLNYLLTRGGLLQRLPLWGAVIRDIELFYRILFGDRRGIFSSLELERRRGQFQPPDPSIVRGEIQALGRSPRSLSLEKLPPVPPRPEVPVGG